MKKVIRFALAVSILAVGIMFFCNALNGLLSLVFQLASIYQHEQFVYDYKLTIRGYCAKYMVNVNFTY
ncbi:hypothetical protein ASE46_02200 [Bacillus sp. Root239]|nr:hypothetical protein ASE46_02200 [Bacillus sp. Root239]